jgi:serine/threonine protein phosphatase PrpC
MMRRTVVVLIVHFFGLLVTFEAFQLTATRPLSFIPSSTRLFAALEIGVSVIPGVDSNRPQKINQDAFFEAIVEGGTCVGVLDGHGLKGHLVTEFIAEQLPVAIRQQLKNTQPSRHLEEQLVELGKADLNPDSLPDEPKQQVLVHAFHQVQEASMENEKVPAGRSGTTCIACLIEDDQIHVAHVGDSRAIRIDRYSNHKDDPPLITPLTIETTTANMPSERQRIDACEGRIDDGGNVWYGPFAIAMTRALGDALMLRAGVLPTPITATFDRDKKNVKSTTLVLATDGIWDVLSNESVRDIVVASRDVHQAAKELADTARAKWIGDFVDEMADDITCMVIIL